MNYSKTCREFPYLIRKIVIKERNFFNPFERDFMKNERIVIILLFLLANLQIYAIIRISVTVPKVHDVTAENAEIPTKVARLIL